ncbi:hypothetical protein BV25DRAFT_1921890 [Artomyces pyxidatus]|uniref:Uncharacterized protein n=1 Tax=Artomyces pyxidatus TaxID=48021 RepID=A0ACB8SHS7_9AGAM|nr:hypothetical protein BV25DRAFT_1921890 [Artomyces pyxidatus]
MSDEEDAASSSTTIHTRHVNLSVRPTGGRRKKRVHQSTVHYREAAPLPPDEPVPAYEDPLADVYAGDVEDFHPADERPVEIPQLRHRRRRRKRGTGNALRDWIPFRDTFLDELIR